MSGRGLPIAGGGVSLGPRFVVGTNRLFLGASPLLTVGGASVPELPTSGLVLHFDGDSLGTVSSAVATWTGLVGGNATQSDAGSRPTVVTGAGGRKAARFDGVNDYLESTVVPATGATGRTLIAVVDITDTAGASHVLHYGGGSADRAYGLSARFAGNRRWANHYWSNYWQVASAAPSGDPQIVVVAYDGAVDHMWVDGVSVGTNTRALNTAADFALTLGSRIGAPAEVAQCDLSAVLAYSRCLSDAEVDDAVAYLADRYDITLP